MAGPLAARRAVQAARRAYPYARIAWERWQALSEEEKERYRQRARGVAERGQEIGRRAVGRVRKARGRKR